MLIKINNMLRNEKGFTIIELMAVLVIIGIIALIAVPRVTGTITQAKIRSCNANVEMLNDALERYGVDHMDGTGTPTYPSALTDLVPNYVKSMPLCPVDGKTDYAFDSAVTPAKSKVKCASIASHVQ